MNRKSLIILALLPVTTNAFPTKEIDDLVQRVMSAQHVPGLALRIEQNGKLVLRKAYGMANIEQQTPASPDQLWDIGSIGKSFTASAVLKLVQNKKLGLDVPISQYVTDLPPSWQRLTIRNLITHTSGLPDYALVPGIGLADSFDLATWRSTMAKQPFDFEPGRMYQYSNTNFFLLGIILESVTHQPYREYISKTIFQPLGMNSTKFRANGQLPSNSAMGYFWENNQNEPMPIVPGGPMPSDGGSFSTIDDLSLFFNRLRSEAVVKSSVFDSMRSGKTLPMGRMAPYGMGLMVGKLNGHEYFGHGGNDVGFSAGAFYYPDSKLMVTMVCNLYPVGGQGFCNSVATLLDPRLKPSPLAGNANPYPRHTLLLQAAFADLTAGILNSDYFDAEMKARLATGRGHMAAEGFRNLRTSPDWQFIDTRPNGPDTSFRFRVRQVDGSSWILDFTVTKDHKIYSIERYADPGTPTPAR